MWDEAKVSATVWFLRKEIGIRTIYYHTPDTGASLRKISGRQPPRPVYPKLPRKFCFRKPEQYPNFLHRKSKSASASRRLEAILIHKLRL